MKATAQKRRLFGLGLLVLAAAFAVLPAGAAEPVVFRRGNDAEPSTLDPHRAGSTWENNIIGDMFLGLTTEDIDGNPIPGAAESWTTSPDSLVWTFKLRPGLKWSDGEPLKASDFVFGIHRVLDPKTAARYAFILYVIKNAEAANGGKLPLDQVGVRALDDRTVEITVEGPTPFLPGLLTHYTAFPIPEHIYKKYGEDWVKPGNMVTNGAYVLTAWNANDYVKVIKNPLFYDAANVAIDEIDYFPFDNDATALARYRAGEIDANLGRGAFPIRQYDWVKENLPEQSHVVAKLAIEYLALNIRHSPFNDARVRRAISLCLDRKILTDKVMMDGSLPAYSFVPPGIANYHAEPRATYADQPMEQRRAEAKGLLADAGYSESKPLVFEYKHMATAVGRRSAIAESAMLKQCGITVHLFANEPKIHYAEVQAFDFQMAWGGWVADYNDPQNFLFLLDSRSGAYNYSGYHNPAFERLMDEAKVTLDIESRAGLLAKAEQMALDEDAIVPLDFGTDRVLVAPYVKGYKDNPANVHRTRWMRIER